MTPSSSDSKGTSPGEAVDILAQENVSQRATAVRPSSKQQIRHRASVACASCRDRRIRCVVPKGEVECTQCKRAGTECVIKNDDERRRPISKAYMSSLSDRIVMLESMLAEKGVQAPPAVHPPKTRQEAQSKQREDSKPRDTVEPELPEFPEPVMAASPDRGPSPPDSGNEDFNMTDMDHADSVMAHSQTLQPVKEPSPFRNLDPRKEDIVHRLLSTKGNLSFDQLSGRFRFFGPTANSHVYAESPDQFDSREPPEQIRRAERIIRSLTSATHDYLMACFWDYYNSVLQVISREAFEADRDSQNPKFYSSFLHITVLAAGYRFADLDRDDIQKITLGNRESTLHRESKYMLDIELERPGGIPSVQALLLLGDMECGVGRDNTGWMYSGMANRLAFDIGLHLDCREDNLLEQEIQIRNQVMTACMLYDKYWALFLGRPTSIKNQDISVDLLSRRFSSLSSALDNPSEPIRLGPASDEEIHEQLVELMELAGKIVENRESNKASNRRGDAAHQVFNMNENEDSAYLQVVSLDRQLQNWYRRLPKHMTWKPENIKSAPFSFFLLHQQYHVTMILLHRPWAKYGAIVSDGASTGSHPSPVSSHQQNDTAGDHHLALAGHSLGLGDPHAIVDDSRTSMSRSICTQQAIRVARVFWQHRQRFDGRRICVTAIQHAGTAAIALIAALAYQGSESDRQSYLNYLEVLSEAISDMSHQYHPAARMDDLLQAILVQLRNDINGVTSISASAMINAFNGGSGNSRMPIQAAWQNISPESGLYQTVPQRRANPDSDSGPIQPFKKRRPGPSRRASEFARPPPPFFNPGTHPTPPPSTQSRHGSFTVNIHNPGSIMHNIFDQTGNLNLDFLNGSAIDFDGDGVETGARGPEDYVLVGPSSSDTWGMGGMASGSGDGTPQGTHHRPAASFDEHVAEWLPGHHIDGGPSMTGPVDSGTGDVPALSTSLSSHRTDGTGDGSKGPGGLTATGGGGGGMEWMGSEGGLDALSPVSLGGLVQSADKAAGVQEKEAAAVAAASVSGSVGRNHELDFFSF